MARPTRAAAHDAPLQDPNAQLEALQLIYALLASATNPDGTPFALPVEGVTGGAAQPVDVSDRAARLLGVASTKAAALAPRGYAQPAVAAAGGIAVALTVPTAGATQALIVPSVAVRWRDDGTAPTATVGMPLAAGESFVYDGSLAAIRFIAQGAAAGVLDVSFYA